MNYYNRINKLLDSMVDDINYIKKETFLNTINKETMWLTKAFFFYKMK